MTDGLKCWFSSTSHWPRATARQQCVSLNSYYWVSDDECHAICAHYCKTEILQNKSSLCKFKISYGYFIVARPIKNLEHVHWKWTKQAFQPTSYKNSATAHSLAVPLSSLEKRGGQHESSLL